MKKGLNESTFQFIRYVLVGGFATVVDLGVLYFFTSKIGFHYLVSAIISFIAGLITNFILSKLFVFNLNKAKVNPYIEFAAYALIGIVGLGLTEIVMYIMTDKLGLHYMISKILVTIIVLAWNYIARRNFLYE